MKEKIYNLLMVEYRALLEKCYRSVFYADSDMPAVKSFEDYLNDFYLYLYEAKPKSVTEDVKGYYLTKIKEEKSIPAWLKQTFHRFLLEDIRMFDEMRDSLDEYRARMKSLNKSENIDITLTHVALAIAWFNQHEPAVDRYIFFRNAYRHFMGFYSWSDTELDDKDVAAILGMSYGTLRTRSSRICNKVKCFVCDINDTQIASLNNNSLEIAYGIYADPDPDLSEILMQLMSGAEKELPQYRQIVDLREKKIHSALNPKCLCKSQPMEQYDLEYQPMEQFDLECRVPSRVDSKTRAVTLFKEFIGM